MNLRMKFKFDTGFYPCFSKDKDGSGHLRGDDVKGIYGEWLEYIFYDGNKERFLRTEFKRDTGEQFAAKFNPSSKKTWYTRSYILWLEEYVLRSKLINNNYQH